jgi:hypothetical protein
MLDAAVISSRQVDQRGRGECFEFDHRRRGQVALPPFAQGI